MSFAENRGAKIDWDDQGQGEPVLLIMGLDWVSDMWYRTRPQLSARHRTIAFDNRGVGRSDVPAGPYPISLMASDAAAVLAIESQEKLIHLWAVILPHELDQRFTDRTPFMLESG